MMAMFTFTARGLFKPSSVTVTRGRRSMASTFTSIRPPRPLRASIAFFTITSSAHSINTGSPVAVGPVPGEMSASDTVFAKVGSRGRK